MRLSHAVLTRLLEQGHGAATIAPTLEKFVGHQLAPHILDFINSQVSQYRPLVLATEFSCIYLPEGGNTKGVVKELGDLLHKQLDDRFFLLRDKPSAVLQKKLQALGLVIEQNHPFRQNSG